MEPSTSSDGEKKAKEVMSTVEMVEKVSILVEMVEKVRLPFLVKWLIIADIFGTVLIWGLCVVVSKGLGDWFMLRNVCSYPGSDFF